MGQFLRLEQLRQSNGARLQRFAKAARLDWSSPATSLHLLRRGVVNSHSCSRRCKRAMPKRGGTECAPGAAAAQRLSRRALRRAPRHVWTGFWAFPPLLNSAEELQNNAEACREREAIGAKGRGPSRTQHAGQVAKGGRTKDAKRLGNEDSGLAWASPVLLDGGRRERSKAGPVRRRCSIEGGDEAPTCFPPPGWTALLQVPGAEGANGKRDHLHCRGPSWLHHGR